MAYRSLYSRFSLGIRPMPSHLFIALWASRTMEGQRKEHMMTHLEVLALDEFIERDVMQGKGDAEVATEVERLVDGHNVGAAGLLRRLPHRAFPSPSHSTYFRPLSFTLSSTITLHQLQTFFITLTLMRKLSSSCMFR